jgi:hypothetical protein
MEKRLEGFVPVQEFAHLRERVEAGFESIGKQIKSSHDAQLASQQDNLEKFLHKRRVKGWLKTHPAKYTRMMVQNDMRILQICFLAWARRGESSQEEPHKS